LTPWQAREFANKRRTLTHAWADAFLAYARANNGDLPATFESAEPFWPTNVVKGTIPASEEFEILYHGSLQALSNLDSNLESIIFRERKLWPSPHIFDGVHYDKMGRFSVSADGQVNWSSVPPGQLDSEFNNFEREHLVPPALQ